MQPANSSKPAVAPAKRTDTLQARTASSSRQDTPPRSPTLQASTHSEIVQLLRDVIKHVTSESKETDKAATPQATPTTDPKPAVRGSRLKVKDVYEV